MIRTTRKRLQFGLAAIAVVAFAAVPVQAGTIDINLTGYRVDYSTDDSQLHDRMTENGGNLDPDEAVQLTGTEFTFDGSLIEQYNALQGDLTYADMLIKDIDPTLTLPTTALAPSISTGDNNNSFGFDWFFDDGGTIRSLRLTLDEVAVALIYNGNHIRPTLVITGSTSNWTQNKLPGLLRFNPGSEISFSYTTSNTMAFGVIGNDFTDLLGMGGVMQISGEGEMIPEPATIALSSLLGTLAVWNCTRRRRRSA